ncbi:MAG: DNA polymerase III subunit delta' [Candidatus Omnitrophota bacterium]
MSFESIKGQDNAIDFIRNSVANDRVSNAYMFIGPSGIGKKLTAVNFAKALNCLSPKGGASCDECVQCRKIDASNHPDFRIFSPAKEDASFGIDKIRAITKDIGLKPYEGKKKVYILDSADSMTQEAQNALLKTLEEPPSDSVLILIVENVSNIFSTIQSRAKRVRFFPLATDEVGRILIDKYELDEKKAQVLARLSSGELGKALAYNEEAFFNKRNRIIDSLRCGAMLDSDFDGFSKSDIRIALDVMLTWYRDIMIAKTGVNTRAALVNVDKLDLIDKEAKKFDFKELNNMISQVILTSSFLEQNINPKLALGVLGSNLMHR